MTAGEPISARSLSIGLLLFGMLWIVVVLMQDFDWSGRLKAVLLLGLAVATAGLTWGIERMAARRPPPARFWALAVAAPGAMLAIFAALTPSRLSAAETVAVIAVALAPIVLRAVGIRPSVTPGGLAALLTILCALLALNRLRLALAYLHAPDMEDIGRTTIAAVRAVLAGTNPYAAPIDLHPDYPDFPGYKYLPMMIAVYAPLASVYGEAGLRLTNLVLDALTTLAVLMSARRMGDANAGLLAACAWLMLPVLPRDIYKHGVTDLAPVLPLVIALSVAETRLGRAGLLIGLSVAAKLFPGLLVALCCLRRRRIRYYAAGGIIGILPAAGFCLWGPADFSHNVFRFILSRPIDETSWMFGLPAIVPTVAKLVYLLMLLAILGYLVAATTGMARRCGLVVLAIIGALLTGPDAHNNYMIWWTPFFCILLGCLVSSMTVPSMRRMP